MSGRSGGRVRALTGARAAALLFASSFFGAACAATYDTGEFPEGAFAKESVLVREWKTGDAVVILEGSGKFSSESLRLEYFNCASNGVQNKSGSGTWESGRGRQRTEVFLKFDDGCRTTLWVGETGDNTVLWGQFGDGGIATLR